MPETAAGGPQRGWQIDAGMQPGARDGNSQVVAVEFISHEATLEKFQQEWLEIVNGKRGKKS